MAAKKSAADEAESSSGSVLSDEWVSGLVAASAALDPPGDRTAVVAVTIGKKQQAVLDIVDGRVIGAGDADAATSTVPVTAAQLAAFSDGSESVARAYMQGDLKPVGSTGGFLALVELFENPSFREALNAG